MKRGTTPLLKFELPFDISELKNVWITFSQNRNIVLNRELTECTAGGRA